MITLNQIKELLIKQENEIDNALLEYFTQNNKAYDYVNYIKKRDKSIIEKLINEGRIEEAEFNINEYKNRFNIDTTIYSMEGIINLQKGDLQKSLSLFELGLQIFPVRHPGSTLNLCLPSVYQMRRRVQEHHSHTAYR